MSLVVLTVPVIEVIDFNCKRIIRFIFAYMIYIFEFLLTVLHVDSRTADDADELDIVDTVVDKLETEFCSEQSCVCVLSNVDRSELICNCRSATSDFEDTQDSPMRPSVTMATET